LAFSKAFSSLEHNGYHAVIEPGTKVSFLFVAKSGNFQAGVSLINDVDGTTVGAGKGETEITADMIGNTYAILLSIGTKSGGSYKMYFGDFRIIVKEAGETQAAAEETEAAPEPAAEVSAPAEQPSFEVKSVIEIPHRWDFTLELLASNELIESSLDEEGEHMNVVYPAGTIVTARETYDSGEVYLNGFDIFSENEGEFVLEKDWFNGDDPSPEITLIPDYIGKTMRGVAGGWLFHFEVRAAEAQEAAPEAVLEQAQTVLYNGTKIEFTKPMIERNGYMFFPLEDALAALCGGHSWNGETFVLAGELNGNKVEVPIKDLSYVVNGSKLDIAPELAPFVENERAYVYLDFIAEGLGLSVAWDGDTKTLSITN
jgi:hypothetical protein